VIADACAANPIALAIPCHRVVRTDGDLAGYRWGIERKRELIRREATARSPLIHRLLGSAVRSAEAAIGETSAEGNIHETGHDR
jgi:hypothetical protein